MCVCALTSVLVNMCMFVCVCRCVSSRVCVCVCAEAPLASSGFREGFKEEYIIKL